VADVHSSEVRSFNMSQIKGKDTKPEQIVRKYLHKLGYRFRLHVKDLPGKPDIVLPKYKTIIFINGCFWHGHHGCRYFKVPKTRSDWWLNKINGNVSRDLKNEQTLIRAGWKVVVIWECGLKRNNLHETFVYLLNIINTSNKSNEF